MKYHVYLLIKADQKEKTWNERIFYVGITSNLQKRICEHQNSKENLIKEKIMQKRGFLVVSLWQVDSREEAEDREKFLIRWFGRICDKKDGQLANLTFGGDGRQIWTEQEKLDYSLKMLHTPIEKVKEYLEQYKYFNGSQPQFALLIGIKPATFKSWVVKYSNTQNYRELNIIERNKIIDRNPSDSKIIEMYNNGSRASEIARILDISSWTVNRVISIKCNRVAKAKILDEKEIRNHINRYNDSTLSIPKYSKLNNINPITMQFWICKYRKIDRNNLTDRLNNENK